jgi:penicillin-binding protein 1B
MRDSGTRRRRSVWIVLAVVVVPLAILAATSLALEQRRLAAVVDEKFSGRRWDFPSRIYSDEFLLFGGLDVEASRLRRRLERLAYRAVSETPTVGGEVRWTPQVVEIALRPGARGRDATQRVALELAGPRIARITSLDGGEEIAAAALEPEEITGIYEGEWKQRRAVRVVDVAPILVRAILATEDSRFFDHHGVDIVGIARAAFANLRSGRVRQGGSTLTQQLMKNFFLTNDRTLSRKLREVAMALVAEQRYSKMQILEAYLNEIYLGQRGARGIFGVAEAARFYFGKDPRDLSLSESALVAGLIRAPNAYSPFQQPERALERRNTVLRLLVEAGEIDEAQAAEARAEPLGVVEIASDADTHEASYFVDYVKSELAGRFPADVLTTEGLRIYTTLDPLRQEQAVRAVSEGLARLEREHPRVARAEVRDRLEAALVAIQPHSGEIEAMVGGRSYQGSQFNRVTQASRQPGSAFKPIVYLAGLLASGPGHVTPATIVDDSPFTWEYDGDRRWSPDNDGGRYRGPVTVRTALEQSLNAATAHVAQGVGLSAIVALAHSLGIESSLPAVPSLVLGAADVTPLELTSVYGVFAAGGTRAEPIAIKRVESRNGEPIAGIEPDLRAVVPPADAYVLTHMLAGVLDRGTANGARRSGFVRPAAGKTGTSNDYRDAWFVGYTPDLVAGVWVGFDQRSPLGMSGGRAALPIWADFVSQAVAALPPRDFPPPPGITLMSVDLASGLPVPPGTDTAGMVVIEEAFRDVDAPEMPPSAGSPDGDPGSPDGAPQAPPWPDPPGDSDPSRVAATSRVGEEKTR